MARKVPKANLERTDKKVPVVQKVPREGEEQMERAVVGVPLAPLGQPERQVAKQRLELQDPGVFRDPLEKTPAIVLARTKGSDCELHLKNKQALDGEASDQLQSFTHYLTDPLVNCYFFK